MTPDERNLLTQFLGELTRAQPGQKDPEAAQQIEQTLRANPDAAYVLVQHAILSDHALNDAQSQIAELKRQLDQARGGDRDAEPQAAPQPSFLGSLFGRSQPNPPVQTPGSPSGAWSGGSAVPPAGQPGQPYGQGYGQGGQPGPFSSGGGVGSFLRSAGTTAAGVAGGAFLFEGLSGLFGGHPGSGFGGYGGGFGGGAPVENVTINEYGDDRQGFADQGGGYDEAPTYDSDDGDPQGDDYS